MISSKEMMDLELKSGIPTHILMENAGKQIASVIREKFDLKGKRLLVVSHHGNNGGDGFSAANHLCDDCEVDVLFLGDEEKLKKEALAHYKKVEENNKIQFVNDNDEFDDYDIILDAILGTGTSGSLREPLHSIIDNINKSKATKISIDIPSGMHPDTGEVADVMVNSDLVVALHDIKKGAVSLKEKTVVVDIGLNK